MMPPQLSRTRIDRALRREEHVLPARLARRIRKLSRQRVRQPDFTETFRHVGRMLQAGALDGRLQRLAQAQRQGHAPVLSALPVAHHDLAASEVDVLHPQAARSEERRVGKEGVRKCRSWWAPYHSKKKK